MTAPRRRWFQFSLRKLFLLTAVCGLLMVYGPDARLVYQRKAFIARGGDVEVIPPGVHWVGKPDILPAIRRLLGDKPLREISMPHDSSDAELAQASELFPEAEVSQMAPPGWNGGGSGLW